MLQIYPVYYSYRINFNIILIFLSIISLNSHSYAQNYCESLTYTKIKTHVTLRLT